MVCYMLARLPDHRINSPADVLSMGQKVKVKLTMIDDKGRLSLSMLGVKQDI